jgi:hypothetical protein
LDCDARRDSMLQVRRKTDVTEMVSEQLPPDEPVRIHFGCASGARLAVSGLPLSGTFIHDTALVQPGAPRSPMKCPAHATLLTNLLVVGACLLLGVQPAVSGEVTDPGPRYSAELGVPPTSLDPPSARTPAGATGMKIHIDPQTGQLTTEPAGPVPLQLSPAEENAFSTSHQGLAESLSPVPGGGVIVNLQGRFQSPVFATVDASGKVTIQHLNLNRGPGETR